MSVGEDWGYSAPVKPDGKKIIDLSAPLPPASHRRKLACHEPHFIEAFSGAIRDQVADFRQLFFSLFNRFRDGEAGSAVAGVACECFQLWCERSYIVPPDSLHRQVERALVAEDASAEKVARLLSGDLGFPRQVAASVSELLYTERKKKKSTPDKRLELLWPLYEHAIWNYATQTAHVYAARLLLYRAGEDQGIFEERISGQALEGILAPATNPNIVMPRSEPLSLSAIEGLRSEMAAFAPSVYESGEFDWWRVVHRDALTEGELERVQSFEEQLDVSNKRLIRLFSVYDLSGVDLDIWRDIYQHYLPAEERQQLGGFYTPQELVDLTLDFANYKPHIEKLCEKSVIDPASGSGAFVVSVLQRLLEHLNDKSHTCHRHLHARDVPDWERAHGMLQIIVKNIHAIDVHPFATFLTFINFLFAVLPLYARVRPQRRSFRLDAAIFSGDSLLRSWEKAPARARHGARLSKLASHASAQCGSAALLCGKPPAFRPAPEPLSSSAQAGRLSLPACAEEVVQYARPTERRSLSAQQTAEPEPSPTESSLIWTSQRHGVPLPGYRAMAAQKLDLVVGNPPWGGILKGRLAPIFDEHYKEQLAVEYRDTYAGKLDIYGLFYDRALQWLKSGGTVALLTQGSFIDKDWAAPHIAYERGQPVHIMGLRRKLAEQASLRYLIDLNPFGKVFFGAMNIPCIGVFDKRPAYEGEQAIVLLSSKKSWPKGMGAPERCGQVVSLVRRCIELVEKSGDPLKQDFVTAFRFPLSRLREFGGARWLLAPKEFKIRTRPEWPRVAQLLEPSQGLTVGGGGCLSIFLMAGARANELGLEKALLYPIIKGHETTPWRPGRGGNVILYPYACDKEGRWWPAFACKKPPVLDALDFEHPADKFEEEWLRRYGLNPISVQRLFEHRRDALDVVKYPRAGAYLLNFYEQLSTRTFKKRNVRDFGRAWYEFIWPRDAAVIFGKPKIISPRLTPHVRFALDQDGIGIQDSCVCLAVSDNTRQAYNEFRGQLSKLLGHELKMPTVLRYLLAFLNSSYAQELLTTGHRPRPGDVFQVSDELLEELSVPVCKTRRELQQLLDAVDACMMARTPDALQTAESRLNSFVSSLYSKA